MSTALRKGDLLDTKDIAGKTRLRFLCPARGLIGYRVCESELLSIIADDVNRANSTPIHVVPAF